VTGMRYSAGIVIHDAQHPHIVRYRSPAPVLAPETGDELRGIVNDVVFPTAIDVPSRFAAAHVRRVLRHGRRAHRARALRVGRERTAAADEESAA
jgi:hypothetical protein